MFNKTDTVVSQLVNSETDVSQSINNIRCRSRNNNIKNNNNNHNNTHKNK